MKMLSIHGLGGPYGNLRGTLLWLAAAALGAAFGIWQGGAGVWDFLLIVMALCGAAAAVLVADAVQMEETGLEQRFAPHLQPRPLRRGLAALLRPAAAPLAASLGLAAVLVWGAPLAATVGLALVFVQVGAVGAVAVLQDRSPAATAVLFLLTLAITGGVFRQALALAINNRMWAQPWWTVAPGGVLTMCLGFALLAIVAAVAAMGWRLRQPVDTALLPLGSVVALALFCVVPLATGLADGVPLRALLLPAMGLALLVGLVQATMPPPRLWPRLPPTLLPLLAAAVTLLPALAVLSTMNEALSAGILLLTAAADAVLLQVFLQRTPAVALSAFAVLQVARAVLPSALGDGLPGWSILSLDGQQGDPVVAALSGAVQLVAALLCLRSARLPPRASAADRAQAPAAMWQFWAAVAAAVSLCAVSVEAAWDGRLNRFYDLPEFVLLAGAGLAWCHLRADIAHRRRVALDGFQQAPRGWSQALLRIAGPIFVDSLAASIGIGNYLILLRAQQPLLQVLRWDAVLGVALAMLASLLALSLERAGTRLRAPVLLGIVWLAAMVLQASAAIGQLPLAFSNTVYSGVPQLDTLARRCLVIVLVVALLWLPAIASALRRWPAWAVWCCHCYAPCWGGRFWRSFSAATCVVRLLSSRRDIGCCRCCRCRWWHWSMPRSPTGWHVWRAVRHWARWTGCGWLCRHRCSACWRCRRPWPPVAMALWCGVLRQAWRAPPTGTMPGCSRPRSPRCTSPRWACAACCRRCRPHSVSWQWQWQWRWRGRPSVLSCCPRPRWPSP